MKKILGRVVVVLPAIALQVGWFVLLYLLLNKLLDGHLGSIEVGAHVAVAHSTGGDAQLEAVHPAAAPLHPGLLA